MYKSQPQARPGCPLGRCAKEALHWHVAREDSTQTYQTAGLRRQGAPGHVSCGVVWHERLGLALQVCLELRGTNDCEKYHNCALAHLQVLTGTLSGL